MSRTPRNQPGPHRRGPTGGIPVDVVSPLPVAMEGLGWGPKTLATAKKKGLRILCFGKRSYIFGGDLLDFLRAQPSIERCGGNGRPDLVARKLADGEGPQQ
jgi:hypothetical protein